MLNAELIAILDSKGYSYRVEGKSVVVTEKGGVYLGSVTTLPEGIQFNNQGGVYLGSLTSLPEGIQFNNQGGVGLRSLTELPEGVQFNNQGGVGLPSLTTLPEGIQFNNQGDVYLNSVNGAVMYRGKTITLRNIDGYTMLITSSKTDGDITIYKARYFGGGDIKDLKKSYVASQGEFHAHGKSRDDALSSLTFKVESETRDKEDVRNDVVRSGVVRILDYRLLTGACKEGVEHHLRERGIDFKKVDSISLEDALKASNGGYGHDEFVRQIDIAKRETA